MSFRLLHTSTFQLGAQIRRKFNTKTGAREAEGEVKIHRKNRKNISNIKKRTEKIYRDREQTETGKKASVHVENVKLELKEKHRIA